MNAMSQCAQKKKIVFLIGSLAPGGAERQCIETAARLQGDDFETRLYAMFGGGALTSLCDAYQLPVTMFRGAHQEAQAVTTIPFWRIQALWALYRYLRRERPDLVHCFMDSPAIYGALAAKLAGVPRIIAYRLSLGLFKDARPYYQTVQNVINRMTDLVLVNSQAVKRAVLARERIAPAKVRVVYNGIDAQQYRALAASPEGARIARQKREEFGIPERARVIGMLANFRACKGHEEFLRAAAALHARNPDVRFLCFGKDGGQQTELEQLARQLGLTGIALFPGPAREAAEVLPVFDILVSASYEEGFSNVILEGMAAGKAIIATAVGGTPEALTHRVTGLLIPPHDVATLTDALASLLADPEYTATLGRQARQRFEARFTMEYMLTELTAVYHELLSTARKQP